MNECSTNGCEGSAIKLGLCSAHYQRYRRVTLGPCVIEGCAKKSKARGLCPRHYDEDLANGATCGVDGCPEPPRAVGLCSMHYYRWNKTGDVGEAGPRRKAPRDCRLEDCANPAVGRDDLCRSHLDNLRAYGTVEGRLCECGVRAAIGSAYCREHHIADVARRVGLGEGLALARTRKSAKGNRTGSGYIAFKALDVVILEHRAVMERILGRPLERFENVHHINGVRTDNRPENLELWTKPQPSGQRPEDLVAWVVHYYPDLVDAELKTYKRDQRTGQLRLIV